MHRSFWVVVTVAASAAVVSRAQGTKSIWSGIYTEAQATAGESLKKLFERIELMPPEKPKSLTPHQYVDLLAYLLSANRFPAGPRPLELDRSALAGIVITSIRPK